MVGCARLARSPTPRSSWLSQSRARWGGLNYPAVRKSILLGRTRRNLPSDANGCEGAPDSVGQRSLRSASLAMACPVPSTPSFEVALMDSGWATTRKARKILTRVTVTIAARDRFSRLLSTPLRRIVFPLVVSCCPRTALVAMRRLESAIDTAIDGEFIPTSRITGCYNSKSAGASKQGQKIHEKTQLRETSLACLNVACADCLELQLEPWSTHPLPALSRPGRARVSCLLMLVVS